MRVYRAHVQEVKEHSKRTRSYQVHEAHRQREYVGFHPQIAYHEEPIKELDAADQSIQYVQVFVRALGEDS